NTDDNIVTAYNLKNYKKNMQLDNNIINNWINGSSNGYKIKQEKFREILNNPFIYDVSDDIREKFLNEDAFGDRSKIVVGLQTGNNDKYLKYKWEIKKELLGKEYIPYAKGGGYSKYANDIITYIHWDNKSVNYYKNSSKARKNYLTSYLTDGDRELFLKEAITYSDVTSNNMFSARYMPKSCVFDVSGSCIFSNKIDYNYLLGFINSKLVNYILMILNPTPHFQVGDMIRIPYVEPDNEVRKKIVDKTKNIIQKKEWLLGFNYISDFYHQVEIEYGLTQTNGSILEAYKSYLKKYEEVMLDIYKLEFEIDNLIYDLYEITDRDIEVIEERFNKSAYRYPSLDNKAEILTKKEFEQLYCIGDPMLDGRQQQPMNIIEIAEYKQINPKDVLDLRIKYNIYRDRDLKETVLKWLRAIVKDEVISRDPKLYLDEDIERIIRTYIQNRFEKGYQILEELEAILEKPLIEIIRVGTKLGSSNTPLAGDGPGDTNEPLLQQKKLYGRGKHKIVVLWHLQQFLLEFDKEKKYVMQNEIRRITELLQQRLNSCKEKLQREGLLKKEITDLEREEKILKESIVSLNQWQVV
ncbi:MAG: hypothetical protein ACOCRK_04970, partial [bacterium]